MPQADGVKIPRRRSATRERLLETAEACFLERGFHGATAEWLAAQAGYTTGAIQSSFGDKASLFLAVLDRRTQAQSEMWRDAAEAPDAERQVASLLQQMVVDDTQARWVGYFEFYAHAMGDPALRAKFAEHLRNSQKALESALEPLARRSSLPAAEFAQLIRAASNGLAMLSRADETTDVSTLMAALVSRLCDKPGSDEKPGQDAGATSP
jgi:AcrR family transcriptional regulator